MDGEGWPLVLTAPQIEARKKGIGGSDAAAAIGVSRWKSPFEVWQEKRGLVPPFTGNVATEWGERLEQAIRQKYSDDTGRVVRLPETTAVHATYPFMLCHPDGVTDDGRLFEAKNTRHEGDWGESGTDQVPTEYLVQVQHNMLVLGLPVADVCVLIAGHDFRRYEVKADAEIHAALIEQEREFWLCVENGAPPRVKTMADARARFGQFAREESIEADGATRDSITALVAYEATKARLEQSADETRARILAYMAEHDTLTIGGRTVATWKIAKGARRLDMDALRAAHPSICEEFTRVGEPSRRFLLKAKA